MRLYVFRSDEVLHYTHVLVDWNVRITAKSYMAWRSSIRPGLGAPKLDHLPRSTASAGKKEAVRCHATCQSRADVANNEAEHYAAVLRQAWVACS